MNQPFLYAEGGMYQILRIIKESHRPIVDTWKEHLRADKVFKKNGSYYFVREVPEAEIVELSDEQNNVERIDDQPEKLSTVSI